MKVTDQTMNIKTELRNIKVGEAFYNPSNGGVYMRTESLLNNGNTIVNAVNLHLGSLCVFPFDHKVIAVDCECVITDK